MHKLNLTINWHKTLGGTKDGLYQLARATQMIADKVDELVGEVNRLEAEQVRSESTTVGTNDPSESYSKTERAGL